MNYGGFGGGYGGYNDPYGSGMVGGGFKPNFGQALMSPGGPPGRGGMAPTGGDFGGRIGDALQSAGGWLTDPEQGMQRQAMLANGLGAVASIYGARKADQRAEKDREEELRREREAKENSQSWDPVRSKLLEQIMAARGAR